MTASVATQQTMRDIREMFDKWHVDMWEPIPDKLYASGVTLRYFRENTWQSVSCRKFSTRAQNLRQTYLLLDRLRIAEKNGVSYAGLTSRKDLVATAPEVINKQKLEDAYFILGASKTDPLELIKQIYLKKAGFYHPDRSGGDAEKFKELQRAYEVICESRAKE